jgi:signal transduction histidine kinase
VPAIVRSVPTRTRLAVLCGGLALLAAALTHTLLSYALPGRWAWPALLAVAAGAGSIAWLLAGRALRPVRDLTATARRVDAARLSTRVGLAGATDGSGGEVRELAETLDQMLARLERACEAKRQFFIHAVEAMKAPMTQQRMLVQAALARAETPCLREAGAALLAVTDRQERLFEELLTLARSEHTVAEPVPVELAEIAYRVTDGLEPQARRAGIELRVAAGPACTPGDPVLLERLARSLLQNAVQYNNSDGWVRVATGTEGDLVRLTVANTGPVVPTGEVPALFEPFRRLPAPAAGGSAGLGLSIVRSVARAHGGRVSAAPRDGGGLVVEVTLPAH